MVDYTKPLEGLEVDGRIVPVELLSQVDEGEYLVKIDGMDCLVGSTGKLRDGAQIRNVQPAWRTSDEQLDRMDALVKRLAGHKDMTTADEARAARQEARDILAAREPVDPDVAIAKQICDRSPYDLTGLNDARVTRTNEQIREAVPAGIKYGRAQA